MRINAPLCNQCSSAQQFILQGSLNCQSCNNYCNGCSAAATQCLACAGGTQRTVPPLCVTCPNQMFLQTPVTNCQVCASYCNNCSVTSTTCTSCQLATQRLNPPNCTTCPPNMFLIAGQDNCQQCNVICNQCLVSANNCVACSGSLITNAPNCDQCSRLNHYIDASNNCQPCASFCNGCVTSATNCIACWPFIIKNLSATCTMCPTSAFQLNPSMCNTDIVSYVCSNSFNRDSSCNCLNGFYNSESSMSCMRCSNTCSTCTQSAFNCLTCNSQLYLSLPPSCNQCIDGYFMLYGTCSQCSNICATCIQGNCITCTSPRINPPLCPCPQGYSNECKDQCNYQCSSCSGQSTNCLTCAGNRINPPLCGCPDGSIQLSGICSSCTLAAPTARFSDDLTQIYVIFSSKLLTQFTCDSLLDQPTLVSVGTNPVCTVNQNTIIITLGTNATITVNNPILINPNAVQLTICDKSISTIVPPLVQMPQNLYPPNIIFNNIHFTTTPCDVVLINLIDQRYSGSRNLKLLSWNIAQGNNNNLSQLIKQWNSQDLQNSYSITPQCFINQQFIEISINYRNFIGQVGNSTLQILISDTQLQLSVSVPNEVYIFDTVEIAILPSLAQCTQQPFNFNISVQISITNESASLNYNQSIQSYTSGLITFDPFQLGLYSTYYIRAFAKYRTFNVEAQQKFRVVPANVSITIRGGDQMIGINQQLKLEAIILNPNKQTSANDSTQYVGVWGCTDTTTSKQCNGFAQNSFTASLNTTNYQPFTALYITIQVYNQSQNIQVSQNSITIYIIENQIYQIYMKGNQYQLYSPMNIYDEVDVQIYYESKFEVDVDNLTYYSSYMSSAYEQNIIQFYYLQTSIIVSKFNDTQNTKFKITVYNPKYKSPSVATVDVKINIPPQQCKLSIFPRGMKFTIQINSCISKYTLQYKFIYYSTPDGFIQDSISGSIQQGILLTEFQISPILETYLYGQNTSMIVGLIKDSYNGLSNASISLGKYRNVEQSLLYYMLQDTRENLARNIMFIMIYASLNNQILSSEYYNKIYEITSTFNQTAQMTQYIQQQLAQQQILTNNQILSQFTTANTYINELSEQLTFLQNQQDQNLYNKNYQIQLIAIQQGLVNGAEKLSFLFDQSQQVQNRRLLDVETQNITSLITQAVSNITDTVSQLSKVNQNQKIITVPQFNLSAQKFSTLNINQNFKLQILNQSNQTVSYKNQNFGVNPYQNESDFVNPIKAPLIVPNLTGANNVQITPANPIPINFPPVGDAETSCASKIGGSWSMDVCSIVKSSNALQCLCQILSPLSIAQALEFILGQFGNLFKNTIVSKMNSYPYAQSLFTYIIAVFVILYFVAMWTFYKKDNIDNCRVYPTKELNSKNQVDRDNLNVPPEIVVPTSMKVIMDPTSPDNSLFTTNSVVGQVKAQQITKIQGFKLFIQNSHVLLELYYRYDEQEPRVLRLSILFLQIVGQICIFVLFGKNLAISIVIALSIFQTTYGVLFQLILSQMIKSKNRIAHNIGMFIAALLTGLCTYLIIAAMALFSSAYYSNIAALSYLASLTADYFVSNILVELGKYVFILKTCNQQKYYKIYDKILPKGLQEITFGRILFETKTKAQIAD